MTNERWWNDKSIMLADIDGEKYALHGWDGEFYYKSWKCLGEYHNEASKENYVIKPNYSQVDEDEWEFVNYEIMKLCNQIKTKRKESRKKMANKQVRLSENEEVFINKIRRIDDSNLVEISQYLKKQRESFNKKLNEIIFRQTDQVLNQDVKTLVKQTTDLENFIDVLEFYLKNKGAK